MLFLTQLSSIQELLCSCSQKHINFIYLYFSVDCILRQCYLVQLSFYLVTVFFLGLIFSLCSLARQYNGRVHCHLQVIAHVNTAIPATFIEQLLGPGSPVMKLRLSSDQAVRTISFYATSISDLESS